MVTFLNIYLDDCQITGEGIKNLSKGKWPNLNVLGLGLYYGLSKYVIIIKIIINYSYVVGNF